MLLLPDPLECNLKPNERVEPERRDVAKRPACLKAAGRVAKDPDKAGGAWKETVPSMPDYPQLGLEIERGEVEAPNPCTVEATRRTKWPPRGQATEDGHGPDLPPRKAPCERDPNTLKGTGTCKPEGELAILKSAAPGQLEVKVRTREGNDHGRV